MKQEDRADAPAGNVIHLKMIQTAQTPITPEQLAIDFDAPHRLIVLVAERLHGATFFRCLLESKPKVVLDFRFAPHFSFKAIDAASARRRMDDVGAVYVQEPTPFHDYTPSLLRHDPRSIALRLPDCAIAAGVAVGPLMVLVKEDAVARILAPYLVGALRERIGGSWGSCIVT